MDIADFRLIYKVYIRSHLEFCIQAWSPHFVKDMEVLENVQRAATNLVAGLQKYSYPAILQKIVITTLVERRVRADMIEVYKLLTGKEQIDHKQFVTLADMSYDLRGHEKTGKRQIKIGFKEIFLQSKSGQWMEWSPGKSCEYGISQQLQECLRPLLL